MASSSIMISNLKKYSPGIAPVSFGSNIKLSLKLSSILFEISEFNSEDFIITPDSDGDEYSKIFIFPFNSKQFSNNYKIIT